LHQAFPKGGFERTIDIYPVGHRLAGPDIVEGGAGDGELEEEVLAGVFSNVQGQVRVVTDGIEVI